MKYGQVACKELVDYFRERLYIEEAQSKLLAKLAKQAGNNCTNGSFAPLWQILKSSSEKQSSAHLQMVQKFQELIKEVAAYNDAQHKKHKAVKEEEASTLDSVQAIQSTSLTLAKAKEIYNQRCLEYEKLKRENATPKEIEKAETKFQKSCEEYKNLVEKYGTIRDNFERRMMITCRNFQNVEEEHLKQMKTFLFKFGDVLQFGHTLIGQSNIEYIHHITESTVEKLLETFIQNKATGTEIPGQKHFEEADLSSLAAIQVPDNVDAIPSMTATNGEKHAKKEGHLRESDNTCSPIPSGTSSSSTEYSSHLTANGSTTITTTTSNISSNINTSNQSDPAFGRNTFRGSKWLWKSKKGEGKKDKKPKKKKNDLNKEEKVEIEEVKNQTPEVTRITTPPATSIPEVDEEGYSVRPELNRKENDRSSFYSSSDSDSEEEKEHKIHIEIKPLTNGSAPLSASIDELRAHVGGLTLSPAVQNSSRKSPNGELEGPMKRSVSVSQQFSKLPSDLLSLGSLQSPSTSSASTPTGGYAFAPSPAATGMQSPSTGSDTRSSHTTPTPTRSEDLDMFSELADLPPALPPKHTQHQQTSSRGSTPVGPPLLPRPPSRRAMEGPQSRGRMSPVSPMNRADSLGSLTNEFRASSMSVGSSRGPSPLTIGMSDIIPIAVAFQEIVHAYFKGTDESRCMVKLTGDMMFSFPAGIVQVLTNNPSPATVTFRLRNASKMENIIPNKQLVTLDENQSTADNSVYEFNMAALTTILRWQHEQNPAASYFNVDILKYQIKAGPGAQGTPLHLVAYWKCEQKNTDLRVDYKYNGASLTSPYPLLNIAIFVPVDGGVTSMQSKPAGQWVAESHRALWRFTELSQHCDDNGTGSLRARFELSNGPSSPGTISAQFSCEGTTLSGADFELIGLGYRVSLIKRRVITGKYICESEPDMRYRYAPPPV